MKTKNMILISIYTISILLLSSSIISKALEFDFVKTSKSRRVIKSSSSNRLLAERDVEVQYEQNEDYFTIALGLGTPPQYFPVQIDTTASVSWVPSSTATQNINVTAKFNNSKSSSVSATNDTIEVEDEDGDVKGFITYDTVYLEGLQANDFGFVQATKYDDDFSDHADGKLGLGFRNKHGEKFNILSVLKKAGAIDKKIFSISETNSTHGKLHIGDYPSEYNRSDTYYSFCNATSTDDLDDDYRDSWVCDMSHIFIGGPLNFSNAIEINGRAIFDSGYSYISVPKTYLGHFKKHYFDTDKLSCQQVAKEEETSFICNLTGNNTIADLESIHLIFGGFSYTIFNEDIFELIDSTTGQYEFLIKFNDENGDVWALGHPFLTNYLTVFNAEENHVGFFRGEKKDFTKEWVDWFNGNSAEQKANQIFYLIVGASILGTILFILIIFIIVHSIKKRRLDEHGPLINEGNH